MKKKNTKGKTAQFTAITNYLEDCKTQQKKAKR